MANLTIDRIDDDTWARFRARAERDRWHLQTLIRQLVADYANDKVSPTVPAPPAPWRGVMDLRCPQCHNAVSINLKKSNVAEVLAKRRVACPMCMGAIDVSQPLAEHLASWAHTQNLPSDNVQ